MVEIVGNGTSSSRSNARTLDWNGNEELAGGLTINGALSKGRLAGSDVGAGSFAFGVNVTADGANSHAEGNTTAANGADSHAEGLGSVAAGANSHAEGAYTTASKKSQHVFGEYNESDPSEASSSERGTYLEIVGNGTADEERSNARTLDWDGNEVLAGGLTLGTVLSCGRNSTSTVGTRSFAFGTDVVASGSYSHAEGDGTTASALKSHAEGDRSTASGTASHAEGGSRKDLAQPHEMLALTPRGITQRHRRGILTLRVMHPLRAVRRATRRAMALSPEEPILTPRARGR